MQYLIIVPTKSEFDSILNGLNILGYKTNQEETRKLSTYRLADTNVVISTGGLGKVQLGVQTQHLLEYYSSCELVICAGAGGTLRDELVVGDIVIGTQTVEHDIKKKFGSSLIPRFNSSEKQIEIFKNIDKTNNDGFNIHFAPVASGDEDISDDKRKEDLHNLTGAFAVGWEGAGCARSCSFSNIPFVEIRSITDTANQNASVDFKNNLRLAMENLANLLDQWINGSMDQDKLNLNIS